MILLSDDVADFVMERARQDPKVRQIVEDVRLYDGLRDHAGWRRLHAKVKESKQSFMFSLSRRLMAGERVSQEEIAHSRGFYEGALWIIEQPEVAESNLEKAARMAWAKAVIEHTSEQEAESPYV